MTPDRHAKMGYLRLETDAEFRGRCCGARCPTLDGEHLDEHVELWHSTHTRLMQRRIIEVMT